MALDLAYIEKQLQKRLAYPYQWHKRQEDTWDGLTHFIYNITDFDELLVKVKYEFCKNNDYDDIFDYTLNRWINYWSAMAVESIFCSLDKVQAKVNARDRLVDFEIEGVTFDHKTSVYPNKYGKPYIFAKQNPRDLINWLYNNQSTGNRYHLDNRLFIILYSHKGEHWKLRADIKLLKECIESYVQNFKLGNLHRFSLKTNGDTLSDLIFAVK